MISPSRSSRRHTVLVRVFVVTVFVCSSRRAFRLDFIAASLVLRLVHDCSVEFV